MTTGPALDFSQRHNRAVWAYGLVVLLCLLMTLLGWQAALRQTSRFREQMFKSHVNDAVRDMQVYMDGYRQVLLGTAGFMQASERVTRQEWRTYFESLQLPHRYPGLGTLGWIEVFPRAMLGEHERRMRVQTFSDYSVKPPGERDLYSAITLFEPFTPENQRAIGLDGLTEPTRRQAMEWARDMGSPALTGKLNLFLGMDDPNEVGMIMYMPVYRPESALESLQDRRNALRGYVLTGFRMTALMAGIFGEKTIRGLDLRVFDGNEARPELLLFDSARVYPADPSSHSFSAQATLDLPGARWTLEFSPRGSLFMGGESYLPGVVLAGGLLLTSMLAVMLWMTARSARRVAERSAELAMEMTRDLRESETRFRQVVEASPNGILLVDKAGLITLCNARLEQMFAYPPGALLGKPLELLLPENLRTRHQEVRQTFADRAAVRLMGQERYLTGLRADGCEFPVEIGLSQVDSPTGRQTLTLVNDVSARFAAERRVQRAQAHLQAVVDAASEFSIIATDTDGLITVFNTGAERMLGYSSEEMVGKRTPAIIHDLEEAKLRGAELTMQCGQPVEGFDVFVFKARRGEAEVREWTYLRKDGTPLRVMLTVTAMHDEHGTVSGFIGIAYDVTARKRTERLQQDALESAEAASRSKSEFLANMSHEIRTPLNAVLGMAQVLGFGKLDAEQREQLRLIEISGKALLGILNDILDFSKIEAGRMELSLQPMQVSEVCDALAGIMAVSAAEKPITMAIDVDPVLPSRILGDPLRLQQVLVNLVGNAIKFTSHGEVVVRLEQLRREGADLIMRCSVSDTGIGMSEEQVGRLFAPFVQADSSMTRRFGGSGLGLVICKRLVDMMGGTIGVTSRSGEGSTFKFTVHLSVLPDDPAAQRTFLSALKIHDLLIVSGSDALAASLDNATAEPGLNTSVCASESEALSRITTQGHCPHLVLLDWNMPDRGRARLLQQLRMRRSSERQPLVLAISASSGRDALGEEPAFASLDGVLVMPVTRSMMLDAVAQALSQRSRSARPEPDRQLQAPLPHVSSLRGVHLLLVEDNPVNQAVACGLLQQIGAEVDIAQHGQEAVDRMRADAQRYSAILMDVQMPIMDGCTATRIIRNELGLRLPIIALTAGVLQTQREECMAAGMDEFLTKPLDARLILEALERVLGVRAEGNAPAEPPGRMPGLVSPAPEVLPNLTEIPGLDTVEALAHIGNDQALYREILLQFCIETRPVPLELRDQIEQGDHKSARRAFHTLKSTAANIGAHALSELAQQGEQAVLQGNLDAARHALCEIESLLEQLLPAIAHALEGFTRLVESVAESDRAALKRLLGQLRHREKDARECFERLRAELERIASAQQLEQLTGLLAAQEFDPAADLLERILD